MTSFYDAVYEPFLRGLLAKRRKDLPAEEPAKARQVEPAPIHAPSAKPTKGKLRNLDLVRNEDNEIVQVIERSATRTWNVIRNDDTRQFAGLREVEAKD